MIIGIVAICVLVTLLLLIAGRSNYWQAWIFGAVNMVIMIILFSVFAEKIGIIRERMHPGIGTKWWDKVFWMIYGPMNLAIITVAALDAGRYSWSPDFHLAVYIAGYLLYLLANTIHLWAILSNDFYTSTVRLQHERGQVVIKSRPISSCSTSRISGYHLHAVLHCPFTRFIICNDTILYRTYTADN